MNKLEKRKKQEVGKLNTYLFRVTLSIDVDCEGKNLKEAQEALDDGIEDCVSFDEAQQRGFSIVDVLTTSVEHK